jgi:hypothetical protein
VVVVVVVVVLLLEPRGHIQNLFGIGFRRPAQRVILS